MWLRRANSIFGACPSALWTEPVVKLELSFCGASVRKRRCLTSTSSMILWLFVCGGPGRSGLVSTTWRLVVVLDSKRRTILGLGKLKRCSNTRLRTNAKLLNGYDAYNFEITYDVLSAKEHNHWNIKKWSLRSFLAKYAVFLANACILQKIFACFSGDSVRGGAACIIGKDKSEWSMSKVNPSLQNTRSTFLSKSK